jgi:alkylmercury lyase
MNDRCSTSPGGTGRVGPFAEIRDHLPGAADALRSIGFAQIRRGHASTIAELATATGLDQATVQKTLDALISRGAAEVDGDRRLVGIGGLSLVDTRHRLLLDGIELHTWCAVDALGIPAALGSNATADTPCRHCGRPLQVIFTVGVPTQPSSIITWYPDTAGTNMRRNFCDVANAFCGRDHLAAWRSAHRNVVGEALTLDQVIARGKAIWGPEGDCC